MPAAASRTAKKSGVNASNPATKECPALGRPPCATARRAWMQIAVISGAMTRNPTTVGTAASAADGDSS
jgi:hypothetical protein